MTRILKKQSITKWTSQTKNNKKKQKGFSLAEVIVAVALVIVISLVAFAVCSVCVDLGGKNHIKNYFMVESNNYIKAYFLGGANYESAINMLTGKNVNYGEDVSVYYDSNFKITDQENSAYSVNLSFAEKFKVECKNASNNVFYMIEV